MNPSQAIGRINFGVTKILGSPYIGEAGKLIERYMRWKRGNRLKLVGEADAPPRTRQIFDEVRHSLGVPVVPVLYQSYATCPEFLEIHWQAFRPAVQSRQFFSLGARLAAESYTRVHNYFDVNSLSSRELHYSTRPEIPLAQVLDYYQYLNPLLLLITSAQMQAFEGPVGSERITPESAQHPDFPVSPRLLEMAEATPAVHRIWDDRRHLLELAFISDEHRALAVWPRFYQEYWRALQQLMRSPLFTDSQYRIGESAFSLSRELPGKMETNVSQLLEAGLTDDDVASLARINEAFEQALSGLILDITFARVACEGGTHREGRARTAVAVEAEVNPADSSPHAA